MSGTHTDAQLLLATQIAYLNIIPVKGESRNVKERIEAMRRELVNSNKPEDLKQLETIDHILDMTKNPEFADLGWEKWTVVYSRDHNSGPDATGMYATLIDTGDGNAIVGFRGSESYDIEQNYLDWLKNDLGLLNSPLTEQQADAEKFLKDMLDRHEDQYNNFDVTGHSLGGNLAEHATFMVESDQIGRCVNFDGPGYSTEYIEAHENQIRENGGKIDHYAWSFVGNTLIHPEETNYQVIEATGTGLTRHDTKNVLLEDGHVMPGERDLFAVFMATSRGIDRMPAFKGNALAVLVGGLAIYATMEIARFKKIIDGFYDVWDYFFSADAEFDVSLPVIYTASDDFGKLGNEVTDYMMDVRSLADGLQYVSLSGYLFQNRFRRIARNLEGDAAALVEMQNSLRRCGDHYQGADSQAESELTI